MFQKITAGLVALATTGCAMNPTQFQSLKDKFSNTDVCSAAKDAAESGDQSFMDMVNAEMTARSLHPNECERLLQARANTLAAIGLIVVGAAAVAAASRGGGGNSYAPTTDYSWDWDQFYDQSGQLVWACRGKQTGQFAEHSNCSGRPYIDATWPGPYFRR